MRTSWAITATSTGRLNSAPTISRRLAGAPRPGGRPPLRPPHPLPPATPPGSRTTLPARRGRRRPGRLPRSGCRGSRTVIRPSPSVATSNLDRPSRRLERRRTIGPTDLGRTPRAATPARAQAEAEPAQGGRRAPQPNVRLPRRRRSRSRGPDRGRRPARLSAALGGAAGLPADDGPDDARHVHNPPRRPRTQGPATASTTPPPRRSRPLVGRRAGPGVRFTPASSPPGRS